MSVRIRETSDHGILVVHATEKLTREDYRRFVPEFESLVEEHGKVRVLFELTDFHGWKPGAMWEDLKFYFNHFRDIERLAVVGETQWEESLTRFCRPLLTGEVRYFDRARARDARRWLQEPSDVAQPVAG